MILWKHTQVQETGLEIVWKIIETKRKNLFHVLEFVIAINFSSKTTSNHIPLIDPACIFCSQNTTDSHNRKRQSFAFSQNILANFL
ncbi:hypothetical protein PanWU01x14_132440 [Parasponia andersonii]|uniref:Uncharacterized protein n=1 Tax=Parasponia andersonii TaxID=3476 RepID=A0A2P5CQJ9_PARAD|nr:hypothetical protein PanWU01x14_132440 [Parasponia andersonii]